MVRPDRPAAAHGGERGRLRKMGALGYGPFESDDALEVVEMFDDLTDVS